MFLRHLGKLSPMLEDLVSRAHCIHVLCLHHASSVEATGDADSVGHRDQLLLSLQSAPADRVIPILEAKKDLIKGSHITSALANLTKYFKHCRRTGQGSHLIREFIPLLNHNKNKLSGQQTINVVKMLNQLEFKRNSEIYSAMLEHIISCVDDLSLKNCCELWNIIQDETINHSLRRDLKTILEKNFPVKLSMDYDESDIEFYQYALLFMSQISQSLEKHDFTQNLMRKICNFDDIIPLQSAISIFITLHSLEYSQLKVDTLQRVQNDLAEQAHLLTKDQVKAIVLKLPQDLKNAKLSKYYNEKLANALARRVIDGHFTSGMAILVSIILTRTRHKDIKLLEYCCNSVMKESLDSCKRMDKIFHTLLPELAALRHRTMFWGEIQDFVREYTKGFRGNPEALIHMASRLISLDWVSNPIVEKIFDGSYRPSKLNNESQIFRRIYQRLKLDPSYNGPLPTDLQISDLESLMQKTHTIRKHSNPLLLTHLEEAIKDPACIQTDVKTRYFHEIDHVIAFHEDGTPAPIGVNSSSRKAFDDMKYIEDLTVPAGAKLVMIIFIKKAWYFMNTNELVGQYQYILDATEMLPYPVVFVSGLTWSKLPVRERTSFLMNEIRTKIDSAR